MYYLYVYSYFFISVHFLIKIIIGMRIGVYEYKPDKKQPYDQLIRSLMINNKRSSVHFPVLQTRTYCRCFFLQTYLLLPFFTDVLCNRFSKKFLGLRCKIHRVNCMSVHAGHSGFLITACMTSGSNALRCIRLQHAERIRGNFGRSICLIDHI